MILRGDLFPNSARLYLRPGRWDWIGAREMFPATRRNGTGILPCDADGAREVRGVVARQAGDLDDVAGVRRVDEQPAAHVEADVVVRRVEEDQVARCQLAHRDVRPGVVLRPGVVA